MNTNAPSFDAGGGHHQPPPKKIRSCSSSESTPLPPPAPASSSATTSFSPPLDPDHHRPLDEYASATLLDAARRYEAEATRRNDEAQSSLTYAREDVLSCMEGLRKAHERLSRAESIASEAALGMRSATEYRSAWEARLGVVVGRTTGGGTKRDWMGEGAIDDGEGDILDIAASNGTAAASTSEIDEEGKHVSFEAPRHHQSHHHHQGQHLHQSSTEATTSSASSSKNYGNVGVVRRKRIRVSEHGWGEYEGQLDAHGEPHGRGTVTWENGGKYDGGWVDGKANGHGTMNYGNGDMYEGGWRDGCRYGHGTHHFRDGGVYEGEWRNAAPDGRGRMTLKNGSHYEGSWRDGKWHGQGIVRPANGGEWEGTFHMGKCTVGTLRRPNGELEIGRYDSVNPDDVKEGVWWSIDRNSIWIVADGQKKEQIDEGRALEMVARLGVPLPMELRQQVEMTPIMSEQSLPVKSEE
ncbi:hypothetical protein ACHAXA_008353 [Cyclostephanos tholiformis]|uniref:Uncharacterized protein n=1 Tax=Cyclostephanos tholiformis TaxID=382380 RepID=A0ABD3RVZ2_9STRA